MNKIMGQVFPICFIFFCYVIPDQLKQKFSLPGIKSVEVELSIPHEEQGSSLYTNYMDNKVGVIFINRTDSAIRMYQDWNLWGYFNISFEIETQDSIYKVYRKNRDWPKNFPSYNRIDPGESIVFNYNLKSLICDRQDGKPIARTIDLEWLGLPEKKYDSAKIRVLYKLSTDIDLIGIDSKDPRYEAIKRSFPTELSSKQYNIHIR